MEMKIGLALCLTCILFSKFCTATQKHTEKSSSTGPKSEKRAASAAQNLVANAASLPIPSRHLLCVVFINAAKLNQTSTAKWSTRELLLSNMITMKSYCDFAVLSYRCSVGAHNVVMDLAREASANMVMYRCVKPHPASKTGVVLKPQMYDRLLPLLPSYQRVWMLDEDLLFPSNFDGDAFFRVLDCAFYPRPAPLVAQTVIAENSQDYDYLNLQYWHESRALITSVNFVEIQTPIFNATFLDWYIRYVLHPIIEDQGAAFVEAGVDSTYCGSAKKFLDITYRAPYRVQPDWFNKHCHACAVVTMKRFAMHHVNFDTLNKSEDYLTRMNRQAQRVIRMFPTFYHWDFVSQPDGVLSPANPSFEKLFSVSTRCRHIHSNYSRDDLSHQSYLTITNKGRGKSFKPKERSVKVDEKLPLLISEQSDVVKNVTKVYALHFPQFHADPLNDKIWGTGYTDWENVLSAPSYNRDGLTSLTPTELGYYNQVEYSVRKAQGDLARQYGVDGFIYHHYFFYEKGLGATLAAPLEALLRDNEPDLPFALHWANQDWSVTWQGKGKSPGELLQRQNYPNASSGLVEEHYAFLRRLFHHRNYILVHGVPLFMVYQTFDEGCWPILSRLRELAMADGFPSPGLHIPQFRINTDSPVTTGVFPQWIPDTTKLLEGFDADVYYPATHNFRANLVPESCVSGLKRRVEVEGGRPVYLSTLTTFDNTPRRDAASSTVWSREWSHLGVVGSFERDMVETMMYDMCCQSASARSRGGEFMLVNAWNEWAEGMVLEPSNVYGREFLEALSRAKRIAGSINCDWSVFKSYHSTVL